MSYSFFSRAGSFLKRQVRAVRMARRGNMAIIFALSIIPVLVTGGAGIDLARALAVRAKLYAAVDAAALAVASKSGITEAQANTLAQQYFTANYNLNNSFGSPAPISVTVSDQQVIVSSNIAMPTTIMGVAGIHTVNLSASSQVVWGQTKIWVGLALDTTGSMCQSDTNTSANGPCPTPGSTTKIYALKSATKQLLTMFQNASATAGDVRVSLTPFSRTVNVGAANSGASWIDWTSWDQNNPGQCYVNGVYNSAYTTEAACSGAGSCTINNVATSQTTQSTCTSASAGVCSVNGTPNNNFQSQTACQNAGSCSISGYYTQNNCQNATTGTCSISGYTSQWSCQNATTGSCSLAGYTSQNSCQSNYVWACNIGGGSYTTQTACNNAGTCSLSGYTNRNACQAAYVMVCSNPDKLTQNACVNQNGCSISGYNGRNSCQNAGGTWGTGTWGRRYGVWTAGVWARSYGVWTTTNGVWTSTNGVWTSTPGVWNVSYGVWTPATTTSYTPNRAGWTGCIGDRGTTTGPATSTTSGYDVVNTSPGTPPESKFPAVSYNACPSSLLGLGYDWAALDSKVDALVAQGNTNQPIGLAWAWHSLSQGDPLNPPTLPSGTTRHIIILSDGENTDNRWNKSNGWIDDRMEMVCDNAKNDGVIIWSVFVNIAGTAGNASSMQNCASGGATGGRYIEVTSTSGIGTAFNVIGQQITNLRVAH